MNDTTAKILAKGCQSTGITEELAGRLHDQLGKKVMAVVELESTSRTEHTDGKETVQLRILSVEPAVEQIADDHLRTFQRALFVNRARDEGQPTLDGDEPSPSVADVVNGRGHALIERDDAGEPVGIWNGDDDTLPADSEDVNA